MDDLVFKPATEQMSLLRGGEISATELLDIHLERIDEVNPAINAIVTLVPELAKRDAAAADQRHFAGEIAGVLDGLPIAHKDLMDTAGIRTTSGSPIHADRIPDENALIVDRLQGAGAVTVGKTNTPEFGAGSQTFNEVFGVTHNPYDLSRTVGGSSGGAAAALASGMLPIADGGDMGGSLRNPASFCNVVGFRVSPGRVPSYPKEAAWSVLSVEGPLGRTVGDVALLLQAMAGPDPRSPVSLQDDPAMFAEPLEADLAELKVAWSPTLGGLPVAREVISALVSVPDTFDGLGCRVEEATPDLSDAAEIFQVLRAWQYEISLGETYDEHHDQLKDTICWNVEEARRRPLTDHARATRKHAALFHRVREFFEIYDVLACPTVQVAPFDVDIDWVRSIDGIDMETYIDWMRSCCDVTVMGCPAISVPAGFTAQGLPVGLQLVGPPRDDLGLLRIAHGWEQATEVWKTRPKV
ncbi:MAG: amidase [bacterium]|nr:amidase [bacterium]